MKVNELALQYYFEMLEAIKQAEEENKRQQVLRQNPRKFREYVCQKQREALSKGAKDYWNKLKKQKLEERLHND